MERTTLGWNVKFGHRIAHQRSLRLKDFDTTNAEAYYVTLVAEGGVNLFGEIMDEVMCLNWMGEIVRSAWLTLEEYFPICHDTWVIMPNHIHSILWITRLDALPASEIQSEWAPWRSLGHSARMRQAEKSGSSSLKSIIQKFKSYSTRKINLGKLIDQGLEARRIIKNGYVESKHAYSQHIWKRNYYEHLVGDETELEKIRQYIISNPHKWIEDTENLERRG